MDTVSQCKTRWNSYFVFNIIVACFGPFLFGYNSTVIDAPRELFKECVQSEDWLPACIEAKTDFLWGTVVSILYIGALVSSFIAPKLADTYGRKNTIMLNNIFFISGYSCLALAPSYSFLVIGRFLIGLAIGTTCSVVPMYLSEISPLKSRGAVGTFHQMACVVGLFLAQLMGIGLAQPSIWRFLFAFGLFVSVCQSVLLLWCCESPVYLKRNSFEKESRVVLKKLWQSDEFKDLEAPKAETLSLSVLDLLCLPQARLSLMAGVLIHWGQQFCGINAVFFFATKFFAGFSVSPTVISALLGFLLIPVTILSIWLIERSGRKSLALLSTTGMLLCMIGLTISMYLDVSIARVIFVYAYVMSFAVGMGPIPWMIVNEIFPKESVAAASTLIVSVNWICTFAVGVSFESLQNLIGMIWSFVPFIVSTAVLILFIATKLKETKGRPAEYL